MEPTMIGAYGLWAASLVGEHPGALSLLNGRWSQLDEWRQMAREGLFRRLARPDSGGTPVVTVHRRIEYEGLEIEELSWQLPYGSPTQALFLKPAGARGPLPGILALHDHGGNKFFGKEKITRTAEERHPVIVAHQEKSYAGAAWANEAARRGYAVLVPDAFAFASRRVRLADVPELLRDGLRDNRGESEAEVAAYNRWAAQHESIMAKSLFCAGTTWPGVFLAEDQRALDVLCTRADVDAGRVGCAGLSGGGLRTVFLGGSDERIHTAVCVGMMTTWRDYLLYKAHTHTWMIYVPLLAAELDYPEILGLRVPQPTLIQNNIHDELFTMPEMMRAEEILRGIYTRADAIDRFACSYYPGPHKFDLDMQADAFDWFDRWL